MLVATAVRRAKLARTSVSCPFVARYTDSGAFTLAKQNLKHGLPGPPKNVVGVGSAAYEAKGALSAGIHVSIGKYVADINLNTIGTLRKSGAVLEPVAEAVAARLLNSGRRSTSSNRVSVRCRRSAFAPT